MNKELMFSSKTDLHATPQDFYDKLNAEFGFNLDVCATAENAKCKRFFDKSQDGLKQVWRGAVWMNPPYGRGIGEWIKKAFEESEKNASVVVCLLPARTDTKWFHDYCQRGAIWFVRGRLKFGESKNAAPFPSMVVQFGGRDSLQVLKALGSLVS